MPQLEILKLEGAARKMIDGYLALPIPGAPTCPYFNNRRRKSKTQLRVLKGKGSPREIAEEAEIDALHARLDLRTMAVGKVKEFLVNSDLGVDCSGFVYHVLNALSYERTGKKIQHFVKSNRTGIIGRILAKIRPAENLGVASFANSKNSTEINAVEARPGDIISFLGTGKDGLYNHILVITHVQRTIDTNGKPTDIQISYAHSYAWPSDGTTNHGVREGEILIHSTDDAKNTHITASETLLAGIWKEKDEIGTANYTYESARNAKEVSVRRLKFNT